MNMGDEEVRNSAESLSKIPTKSTAGMHETDRVNGIEQMLVDLRQLAEGDGCIAAAWAYELATEVAAELDRREKEAVERNQPIAREWLRSLGFERCKDDLYPYSEGSDNERLLIDGSYLRLWPFDLECWLIQGCDGFELKTRGQLLDLLKALKGGEA
jgi:hypothetical protein